MTTLSKTAFALLLLAGGFVAAKTFGPPDLAKRLVDPWRPSPESQWGELRPAARGDHQTEYLAPLDAVEMPASFSSAYTQPQDKRPAAQPNSPPASFNDWPPMPPLPTTTHGGDEWTAPSGVQRSAYEQEMVDLRPLTPTPPATRPQPFEAAKPPADAWQRPVTKEVSVEAESAWPPAPRGWPAASTPTVQPPAGFEDFAAKPAPSGASQWRGRESGEPLVPLAPPGGTGEPRQIVRTHIVADGDSLSRLAERYLGDASRSGEIFERNRELLTHPDLLPLGVELRLP